MKCERISLADCAEKALAALDTRVQETGAEITCDELPEVVGDSLLLTQLYRNLIGNALRFIAEDRPLRIHLTAEESGGEWVLGVRDNGIGIKAEYFQQIFAPFKRLHGRSKYGGSGIGLAICRKAVERHGGQIWVESEPGQGACFKFTVSKNMEIGKWKDEMARRPLCSS